MKTIKTEISILAILLYILSACTLNQPAEDIEPAIPAPVEPAAPAFTEAPVTVNPPVTQPTSVGSLLGAVIYDDGENIVSINPDTGESKTLASRKELQLLLGEDKSAESYTYGYARPIPIDFTSDFTKALVTICAGLDSRFRCAFEYYIYFLESKTAIRLPTPPETYGVYWKWSPDGSTLAGAAWGYDRANYKLTNFYAIGADGDVLNPLGPVTNEHWQIAWNPGSKAFHPLTFVTNFRSIFADDSGDEDIPISGLEFNDKVECLAFSPDGGRAAFVVRRDVQKNHDLVYSARSNFTDITQLTEYDMDSKYLCNVGWSPDGRFVHVQYMPDPRAEAGAEKDQTVSKPDRLVNVETASLSEAPGGARICGWTPDDNLIIEKKTIAGNEGGIELVNPSNFEPLDLPPGLQSLVKHCPVQWLKEELAFEIPIGLSVKDACHPGGSFQDAEDETAIPELFDFVGASASLEGETLTAVLTMKSANPDLTSYLTPDVTNFVNGFDILVDVDNNVLSGDRVGMEFASSIGIKPGTDGAAPTIEGSLLKFDPSTKSFTKMESITLSFDPNAKTVSVSFDVPGITADSRLVFLSRMADKARNAVIGDRICD